MNIIIKKLLTGAQCANNKILTVLRCFRKIIKKNYYFILNILFIVN